MDVCMVFSLMYYACMRYYNFVTLHTRSTTYTLPKNHGKLMARWAHHCRCWRKAQFGLNTMGLFCRSSIGCRVSWSRWRPVISFSLYHLGSCSIPLNRHSQSAFWPVKRPRTIAIWRHRRVPKTQRRTISTVKDNASDPRDTISPITATIMELAVR